MSRRWLLVGVAALVAAGGGTALGLGLAGSGPGTQATHVGRNPLVQVAQANTACSWSDQNDAAVTTAGQQLTCRLIGNDYVWTPS